MHFTRKVHDFGSGQACVFENVMEEIQNSWDRRCCIPGSIPAGRHLTPTFHLPAVLTKIIAAFLKRKNSPMAVSSNGNASWGTLVQVGTCFVWHRTCCHLGSVHFLQWTARTEWIIECAAENIMIHLYGITKVSLFLFLWYRTWGPARTCWCLPVILNVQGSGHSLPDSARFSRKLLPEIAACSLDALENMPLCGFTVKIQHLLLIFLKG